MHFDHIGAYVDYTNMGRTYKRDYARRWAPPMIHIVAFCR